MKNKKENEVSRDSKIAEMKYSASDSLQILYLLSQYLRPLSKFLNI